MADILDTAARDRVVRAIQAAERRTSGEIRVHLQRRIRGDVLAAAQRRFEQLGMTATAERNGVLFFVVTDDRQFAVLGDSGINARVPADFWSATVAAMAEHFRNQDLVTGLEAGITRAGEALAEYFPHRPDDRNELANEISTDA
jgi:uncharacterized membrane protein